MNRAFAESSLGKALIVALAGVVSFAWVAGIGLAFGPIVPNVEDEYSYLLAGDTFAHGRLSNPTHPMWEHFECLHVLQQPTYMSKYPPGQGMALALGQVLTGWPIVGVWLSGAAACAAACWMMLCWLPLEWALVGTALVIFNPMMLVWGECYWGGNVAVLGGALVVGATILLTKRATIAAAIVLAVGAAALANSRPFEGMFLVGPAIAAVGIAGWGMRGFWSWVVGPIICVAAVTGAAMAYYNDRVTGDPWLMPYVLHIHKYMVAPVLLFEREQPVPEYRFPEIRDRHAVWEVEAYRRARERPVKTIAARLVYLGQRYYFGPCMPIGVVLLGLPWAWRKDRKLKLAAALAAPAVVVVCIESFMNTHYLAAELPVLMLLSVGGLRWMWYWPWRRTGRVLVGVLLLLAASLGTVGGTYTLAGWLRNTCAMDPRVITQGKLEKLSASIKPDRAHGQLALVRLHPDNLPPSEWVYNAADVDSSPVVWAHDMGPQGNRELLEYYRGRTVWLVDANSKGCMTNRYDEASK